MLAAGLTAMLAACASSGGTPGKPDNYPYPTLAAATPADTGDGLHATYTLDDGSKQLAPASATAVTAAVNTPAADQITLTVTGLSGDSFAVVLPVSSLATVTAPLANSPIAALCANCLRVPNAAPVASDGKPVAFVYLDPAAAGLQYSTLGLWSKEKSSDDPGISNVFVGGAFSLGVLTRGVDIPTTGSATYRGPLVGRYADGANTYLVGADAAASANFGIRQVSLSTTSTQIARELGGGALDTPVAESRLNLTGVLTYAPGTNQLAGTVFTQAAPAGFNMSGSAQGAFYGPPASGTTPAAPAELGGTLSMSDGASRQLQGAFALKRQ